MSRTEVTDISLVRRKIRKYQQRADPILNDPLQAGLITLANVVFSKFSLNHQVYNYPKPYVVKQ